jgi:hypothetical protein
VITRDHGPPGERSHFIIILLILASSTSPETVTGKENNTDILSVIFFNRFFAFFENFIMQESREIVG